MAEEQRRPLRTEAHPREETSGVYTVFTLDEIMRLPVEISFDGVSTRPAVLKSALESVIEAHRTGDRDTYEMNRALCRTILREGMPILQETARYLVDNHMSAYEFWDSSCAGMAGFTYRNCSKPRDPLELQSLLGRIKGVPRLAKKYLEKSNVDEKMARDILNKGTNWRYNKTKGVLVYTMPDLNALRAKFKDRDAAMYFVDRLYNDSRIVILDTEEHNKPPRKEGVEGYKGIHVQAIFDSENHDPRQVEIQLHPGSVFYAAQQDDYHRESKRCLEAPPGVVECFEAAS